MRAGAAEFLQNREYIKLCRIAIGVVALRQRARFFPRGSAGDVGDQFKQRIRRHAQRYVFAQDIPQGASAQGHRVGGSQHGDDLVDIAGIVFGKHAETVADRVFKTGFGEIKLDMPGVFFRAVCIQLSTRFKARNDGRIA